jgi:RAB protein geranylgeranyltransferase component A
MSLEQTHYSVVLLGTGLTEAILAAALSKAGHSVLHADPAPFYGDRWASLSLRELATWAQTAPDTQLAFPAFSEADGGETSDVPAALAKLDRPYALSLTPALLPAAGAALDILVRSRVASYATFRLLERTLIFEAPAGQDAPPTFRSVPCSKEDIFRDRSLPLADKRRVMKLLMGVAAAENDGEARKSASLARAALTSMHVSGHDPDEPFLAYLQSKHGISAPIARALAFGVSLCSSPEGAPAELLAETLI